MKFLQAVPLLLALALAGCGEEPGVYQGYVEGEFLYLASSQPGRMDFMAVHSGQRVAAGEVIFTLDADYEKTLVRQAEAELASARDSLADLKLGLRSTEIAAAEAQVAQARATAENSAANLRRLEALYKSASVPKSQYDTAKAAAEADAARVEQLESQLATAKLPTGRDEQILAQTSRVQALAAALDQANWRLNEKTVKAPAAGLVCDLFYRPGEWVAAGGPAVRFLPPENVKVRFFVPEKDFGGLALGHEVLITIDGRAEPAAAVITYLAPEAEYTPPVIYSNESRSKLVFMVEARPLITAGGYLSPGSAERREHDQGLDGARPLRGLNPGQPVTVRMSARSQNAAAKTSAPGGQTARAVQTEGAHGD